MTRTPWSTLNPQTVAAPYRDKPDDYYDAKWDDCLFECPVCGTSLTGRDYIRDEEGVFECPDCRWVGEAE